MTLVDIRDTLVEHLHSNWKHPDVDVYYENTGELDLAQAGDVFLKCEIDFDGAEQANVAPDPFHRIYGTIAITVVVKEAMGTRQALIYLDELSNLFKFKNLSGVHTQAPRVGWEQKHGGRCGTDLRVSFYADSNA